MPMNTEEEKTAEVLQKYGGYALLEEIARKQKKVIAGVKVSGKTGKLVITLGFKKRGAHDIIISSKVVPMIPELDMESTIMFSDSNHELHDGNPDQMKTHDNVLEIGSHKEVNEI